MFLNFSLKNPKHPLTNNLKTLPNIFKTPSAGANAPFQETLLYSIYTIWHPAIYRAVSSAYAFLYSSFPLNFVNPMCT